MTETAPTSPSGTSLWNPNAASVWSILFTPVFGAWLHALNWRALGDPERERASMAWVYGGLALLALDLIIDSVVPDHAGFAVERTIEAAYLVAWYFRSARPQATLVKEKYGASFEHKSWRQPLLMALAGLGIYILLTIAIAAVIGLRYL